MIARARRALGALCVLAVLVAAVTAFAEEPAGGAAGEERAVRADRRPANVPFLFSAFALTWIAVWLYLVRIDHGQRKVAKLLERMEAEKSPRKDSSA